MSRSSRLSYVQKTFLVFLISIIVLYTQLFLSDFLFNIDQHLISTLEQIHSLSDYFSGIANGSIYDIQPIRDLSYLFDLTIKHLFNFSSFLATNLLIWALCGAAIIKIFNSLHPINGRNQSALILIFLLHPLFTQSVALLAARKHLLSLLFILWAIYSLLTQNQSGKFPTLRVSLLFIFSLLSHPIQILFPIWCVLFYHFSNKLSVKNALIKASPLFLISFVVGLINIWWYFDIYEGMLGVSRHDTTATFADILLAYGRYFSFIIIPTKYAIFYGKQSPLTIGGLLLLPIAIYLSLKSNKKKENILCFSLFLLSLIPVTYKIFWFFVSDTYILLGSLCIFALIYLYCNSMTFFETKWMTSILIITASTFFFLSFREVNYFLSASRMIEKSYENDDNCINLNYYVKTLFIERKLNKASKLGRDLIERKCLWASKKDNATARDIFAYTLIYSDSPDFQKRHKALEKLSKNNLYYQYGMGVFYLNNLQEDQALHILGQTLETSLPIKKRGLFTESYLKFCRKYKKDKNCQKLRYKLK